jgi:hypothetical protein
MAAMVPASGQAQDATALPDEGGLITLVGCLQLQQIKGHEKYVLANPTVGSVVSVPEATCSTTSTENAVRLDKAGRPRLIKQHVDSGDLLLGHWVEVSGRLEKFESAKELRELTVKSFRMVPVVPPRAAEAVPPPIPEPRAYIPPTPAPIAPIETPVATTGVKRLPHTASQLPLVGLLGLATLAGGLAFRLARRREIFS